jgi:hypothetical protein
MKTVKNDTFNVISNNYDIMSHLKSIKNGILTWF